MEVALIFVAVLLGVIAILLAALLVVIRSAAQRIRSQFRKLSLQLEDLRPALTAVREVADQMKKATLFQEGMERIAQTMVSSVTSLESSITTFTRMSLGIEPKRAPTFEDLGQQTEIERIARENGFSMREAEAHARRDRVYSFEAP